MAAETVAVKRPKRKKSRIRDVWRQLKKNKGAVIALVLIAMIFSVALLAPLIAPYAYDQQSRNPFAGSSREHLLGTDRLGRDVASRLIYGSRQSLQIGLASVSIAAVIGITIGAIAGYYGGWTDNLVMRFLDIYQSIPMLLLCITLAAVLGPSLRNAILAIAIASIPQNARLMRAAILQVREMEYIEAAHAINASNFRIIRKHIIPNAIAPMIVNITMGIGGTILFGATLSYIGLGVQPPTPEWGSMIAEGRNFMRATPTLAVYPGICVIITVLSLNMLGDGLRDALDPRLKN